MKKLILVVCVMFLINACASQWTPVVSLEELLPKEELEKQRNWYKESQHGRMIIGGMEGSLILAPIAFIYKFTPSERDLTITDIADTAAAKNYDYNSIIFGQWISYHDMGFNRVIASSRGHDKNDSGLKPMIVRYQNHSNSIRRIYIEGRVIKKIDNKTYWQWRIPLLEKSESGGLAYVLDKKLAVKGTLSAWEGAANGTMVGTDTIKNILSIPEKDVLDKLIEYFLTNEPQMSKVKCAHGEEDCGARISTSHTLY